MRIVKLSKLDEEERQRVLEEQNQRIEQNNLARQQLQQQANDDFNNLQNNTQQNASNIANRILGSTENIVKRTGAGLLGGLAGIPQAGLTEMAYNANTGKKKNFGELSSSIANGILGLTNPIMNMNNILNTIPTNIKQTADNFGNKDKSFLEKVIAQGLNANTNALNSMPGKNFIDSTSQLLGKIAPDADRALMDVNNMIQAPINKMNEKIEEESKQYGKATNLIGSAMQSIGNMAPSIAVSALTRSPSAGLATMGLSAKGQSTQEALNKGADLENAIKIGNAKGMVEVGTEMLTGGVNIFGKGALDDIVEKGILDRVKNNVAKFFVKQGLNASGEVLEETISDIAGTLIDKGTVDPNASYSIKDWSDTALSTVLTTTILNVLTGGMAGNINEIKQENQAEQNAQEMIAPIGENVKKQNKSFEDIAFDAMFDAESNEVESPLKNRDIETIGKQTKVNAYQYDNPKVKPYFQEMAQMIGEDLSYVSNSDNRSTKKGGGTKLSTTTNAIDTLHNEMGYSYNEIAKGLQNIIDDNGSENNAISKKIELIIDDQLRNGYRNALGRNISPNQEYIDTITTKQEIQKTKEILPTKGDVNWNDIERPEDNKKTRKHYRSIIQSDQTTAEAKAIAKELMGTDAYVPETNKGQLAQADERITNSGPDVELKSLLSRAINGEKISSVDIAVGERLIQYYSKTGNKQQLQEAIQATALAGTSAGQTVQALSLLNHQTPQGQATWIQRSVDKMNKELAKKKGGTITTDENGNQIIINKQGQDITNKVDLFNLTPEMAQKILNSTEKNMWKNIDEVYEELGQQVPKSAIEKIDSWRYFSMLANPRTHIRNMVGNFAMGKMQTAKNKVAGAIEDVASKFNPNMERSHTLKSADKKTKEFSKNDFKNADVQSRLELNENKYNPQSRLQNARRTFKSDAMEKTLGRLFDLNDNLLEAEDGIGLKAGYIKAMNEYLTANKIDVDKISDKQLNTARNYAIEQAKEATFHQANAIASAISQFQNKNGLTKFAVDAILPFKKTPMNVAKSGIEYSPVQIAKSATMDLYNLKKGKISINQYIDNLSKGLTGTGIAFAGYALAKAGILKASGSDDKDKEKYDEEQGKQSYAITIGGKTYSLDWLAPTGIPLFVGAEFQRVTNQDNIEKNTEKTNDESKLSEIVKSVANLTNAGATAINPMSEMSMISGLTNVLSSYNKENALGDMMTNAGKSYINQFVPTILGQTAKTTDKYERTTTSTKTGTIEKAVDQTINQIKSKVPGLRQTLPVRTDIWGKDKETEPNLPLRALNNFFNPATVKKVSTDKVDQELNKLYDVNGSSSILPDILQKTLTIDNEKYRLTNKEYADYTKKYGETSYNLINSLVSSNAYKTLTQTQKEEAIANIYSFAKESNKIDYANKNGVEVKPSTLYTTMESLKKDGGKQSDYLNYLSKTKTLSKEKDKNQALANSSYSDKTKEIIYTNGTGKDDKLYNSAIKNSKMNITEYLNYKVQESNNSFSADKTEDGKSVSGSSKQKYYEYVNKNITGYENRLLILGSKYKLSDTERKSLAEYINNNYSKADLIGVYENLDKNFTVKNGKVYYK